VTKRRVVVTGVGMVTPLGLSVAETWSGLLKGKSGVGPITAFDASSLPVTICASVKNFDPSLYMEPKKARKFAEFVQYAAAAAQQALDDADFVVKDDAMAKRVGVALGSGIGGLGVIEVNHKAVLDSGPRRISPFFISGAIINMAAGYVSIKHNLKGPNIAIVTACTTGAHNIGHAARMISYGDADVMVAGGTEMATCILGIGGFAVMRALSRRNDDPEKASRPWDKDRDGFVLGEGAGVMILEEYEHAKARGANIYAELAGFGMSGDAFHMTAPSQVGAADAIHNALQDAGVNTTDIDYVNAHGTSTPVGDRSEVMAMKHAFGDHAYKLAVSSTKSMTGHLLGAAGAVEAIISVLAIRDQVAPPTINLDNPDEDCDLDFVPHTARDMTINYCLSNSFGFGGTNGSLLFKRL